MAYTAPTSLNFRTRTGTKSQKLATQLSAIETELGTLGTFQSTNLKVAKIVVTGGLQNIISFAWANPETTDILVTKVVLRITTQGATATAAMDIGATADATSTADDIMDGVALTATGLFDNVTDKGTNGLPQIIINATGGSKPYITGKIITAAAAALVGKLYVFYTKV